MNGSKILFEKEWLANKYQNTIGGSEMISTVMATECIDHSTQNIFRGAAIALLLSLPFWLGLLGLYLW